MGVLFISLCYAELAQADPIVQTFYASITEPEARTWMMAQTATAEADIIRSVISMTGTDDETPTIYYDHWEDGYEDDITNPQQSTTEVLVINAEYHDFRRRYSGFRIRIRDQGNLFFMMGWISWV